MNIAKQSVIIRNVRLPGDSTPHLIVLKDGRVESLDQSSNGQTEYSADSIEINAAGMTALPGMIDLYARLREPGLTRKGTIARESQAALAAGFTCVLCAPDTQPAIDSVATVELVQHRAEVANGARVIPMAALTVGLQGEQLSELATLQAAGCPVAGQADHPLESTTVLHSAMEYAASFNMPLFMTARDAQLGASGCAHAGAMATRLGLPGIPVAAETVALARLLELCSETGCRLHISRISSARAVQMVAAAKQQALPVSCDVGLHHLFFTDEHLSGYDSSFHSAVPFRSHADRDALRQGLVDGVIDAICSDHAPHDHDASLAPFPATEPGLAAYRWAIPLILQLPDMLDLPLQQVISKLSDAPRRIINGSTEAGLQPGAAADFFLLTEDHSIEQDIRASTLAGHNHPLNIHDARDLRLQPLRGRVTHVFSNGQMHVPGEKPAHND
ncbi:dihydroorotase [Granulosicoccus sp. 3-233]|uniref:dihydroorotase n=1 Tax=Granulosicoccus sp. 3-233 TaxID=3417969 RepID=UPI003D3415AF